MLDWKKTLWLLLAIFLAVGAFIVAQPRIGTAQTVGTSGDVAITEGPGGVWVVRGNRVYICDFEPVRRVAPRQPPTPRCGQPFSLP